MNVVLTLLFLIQGLHGYCEDFCVDTICTKLTGNIFSECADCGLDAKCNFGNDTKNISYTSYYKK